MEMPELEKITMQKKFVKSDGRGVDGRRGKR